MDLEMSRANKMLRPHHLLIKVLATQYQAMKNRESGVTVSLVRLLMRSLGATKKMRWVHFFLPGSRSADRSPADGQYPLLGARSTILVTAIRLPNPGE
jgi:hypothetical protein